MEADHHQLRLRKKTLQSVLEQSLRALDQLQDADTNPNSTAAKDKEEEEEEEAWKERGENCAPDSPTDADYDTDELCVLLKSKVDSPDFLEKLGSIHMSVSHCISADDSASWDMVSTKDLWEDKHISGDNESDEDGYVLVKQEDIIEGIACFMAAYLLSLEQTKELNPNQLQEVLSKTFSVKKKKSKLKKVWDGSKVIYNVASWSATAIGYVFSSSPKLNRQIFLKSLGASICRFLTVFLMTVHHGIWLVPKAYGKISMLVGTMNLMKMVMSLLSKRT